MRRTKKVFKTVPQKNGGYGLKVVEVEIPEHVPLTLDEFCDLHGLTRKGSHSTKTAYENYILNFTPDK